MRHPRGQIAVFIFSRQAFGEDNVQIAKHFGNLGRLYQSMRRYDVSFLKVFIFML